MQTATATKTPTGYWIAKCVQGHVTRHTDAEVEEAHAAHPNYCTKYGYTICHCNGTAKFTPIVAKTTRTECGPRCTGATGPACDCKCGGENHAGGH
jgi:hypothetical protein